jgi:hypothetical protein
MRKEFQSFVWAVVYSFLDNARYHGPSLEHCGNGVANVCFPCDGHDVAAPSGLQGCHWHVLGGASEERSNEVIDWERHEEVEWRDFIR